MNNNPSRKTEKVIEQGLEYHYIKRDEHPELDYLTMVEVGEMKQLSKEERRKRTKAKKAKKKQRKNK